jgi:DNA-binding GntR family transcriptional regulator
MVQVGHIHNTIADKAYQVLRNRIVQGELGPGERLTLRPIARSLGTSIAPIHEAFRKLSSEGLIELEPRWGARVRRIDADMLRSQHVLRTALECEAARQAAERSSEAERSALQKTATRLDEAIARSDPDNGVQELDSQFHLMIAKVSGSPSLVQALESNQLVRLLARGRRVTRGRKMPARQHLKIVEAIATGDPDQAERVMREHCVHSMQVQLDAFAAGNLVDGF